MNHKGYLSILLLVLTASGLVACAKSDNAANAAVDNAVAKTKDAIVSAADTVMAPSFDFDTTPSGRYQSDKGHAYITFTYSHKGFSNPYVRFRDFDSVLNFDAANPSNSSVTVDINVSSIDTGVDEFDDHLRDEKFFNVAAFPRASFASTSINLKTGTLSGDLTMKGVTKPVTLDLTLNAVGKGRDGSAIIGVSARGDIKRSDWDLGLYAPMVGDDVALIIEVEFNQAK